MSHVMLFAELTNNLWRQESSEAKAAREDRSGPAVVVKVVRKNLRARGQRAARHVRSKSLFRARRFPLFLKLTIYSLAIGVSLPSAMISFRIAFRSASSLTKNRLRSKKKVNTRRPATDFSSSSKKTIAT